eukprot:4791103-Amphidinium_carterae.1
MELDNFRDTHSLQEIISDGMKGGTLAGVEQRANQALQLGRSTSLAEASMQAGQVSHDAILRTSMHPTCDLPFSSLLLVCVRNKVMPGRAIS